jgi:hypothetical protein
MDKIVRQAKRVEKRSIELLERYKKNGHLMTLDGMKDGIAESNPRETHDIP